VGAGRANAVTGYGLLAVRASRLEPVQYAGRDLGGFNFRRGASARVERRQASAVSVVYARPPGPTGNAASTWRQLNGASLPNGKRTTAGVVNDNRRQHLTWRTSTVFRGARRLVKNKRAAARGLPCVISSTSGSTGIEAASPPTHTAFPCVAGLWRSRHCWISSHGHFAATERRECIGGFKSTSRTVIGTNRVRHHRISRRRVRRPSPRSSGRAQSEHSTTSTSWPGRRLAGRDGGADPRT